MRTYLEWHEVAPCVWQAGGLSRVYEITVARETGHALFTLEINDGDRFPEYVGEYKSLDQAQRTAQRLFHSRASAGDPLGDALARFHPERMVPA